MKKEWRFYPVIAPKGKVDFGRLPLDERRQLVPDSVQAEPSLWSFYISGRSPPWTAEA